MSAASLPQYSESENRALKRIVGMIASTETRAEKCYSRSRKHERKEFQGPILVCLPTVECPEPGEDQATFPAWAYNLSQGGVGFVALVPISQPTAAIGLKRPDGSVRWMTGRVVRTRPIPDECFIDYGVAFQREPAHA